jgi:hypothetical protein
VYIHKAEGSMIGGEVEEKAPDESTATGKKKTMVSKYY